MIWTPSRGSSERYQELIGDLPGAITVHQGEGLRAAPVDMHDGGGLISKNARYLGILQELLEPSHSGITQEPGRHRLAVAELC